MAGRWELQTQDATFKRTFAHHAPEHDRFDVIVDGANVATVDYKTARALWTGEKTLQDAGILADENPRE